MLAPSLQHKECLCLLDEQGETKRDFKAANEPIDILIYDYFGQVHEAPEENQISGSRPSAGTEKGDGENNTGTELPNQGSAIRHYRPKRLGPDRASIMMAIAARATVAVAPRQTPKRFLSVFAFVDELMC